MLVTKAISARPAWNRYMHRKSPVMLTKVMVTVEMNVRLLSPSRGMIEDRSFVAVKAGSPMT